MAVTVRRESRSPRIPGLWARDDGSAPLHIGYRRVVGVLQPGASFRALGRHRPDATRAGRDLADQTRVDGAAMVNRVRRPGSMSRIRRLGGGQPPPARATSAGPTG